MYNLRKELRLQVVAVDALGAAAVASSTNKTRAAVAATSTLAGCRCLDQWQVVVQGEATTYHGTCANPTDDPRGSWCMVEADSCQVGVAMWPLLPSPGLGLGLGFGFGFGLGWVRVRVAT